MREVRLIALWRDDPAQARLTVGLRLDADGRAAGHWDVFGAFDLDGPARRPFILRRDGRIDFDARVGETWRTDLREVKIEIGARFLIHWNEQDRGEYEIVKIAVLGAKDHV